ncbi:hypothetical protein EVAR_30887_1 [Eumeta japonica]|uniref:Uncharacterized protein n=1 Tax=Eumeta variegata TaxID=151549 RepID=A0A4C1V404_EUMVA|nr:hypothetical protein EVAR_30887_1 [Eumeta japonica]
MRLDERFDDDPHRTRRRVKIAPPGKPQKHCESGVGANEKKFKKNKIFYNEYKLQIANLLENDTPNPAPNVTSNMVFTTLRRSSPQKGTCWVYAAAGTAIVKIREEDRDSLRFLEENGTEEPGVQNELAHLQRFVLTISTRYTHQKRRRRRYSKLMKYTKLRFQLEVGPATAPTHSSRPRPEARAALSIGDHTEHCCFGQARRMNSRITNTTYWTDSKTVLSWINADPRSFKPFVAHRLAEIEETSSAKNWRWVPV